MASETILHKAIETVTKATEEDRNKNYEEALRLYDEGIDYFTQAIKYEAQSEKVKESIRIKCLQYSNRAEKIKQSLNTNVEKAIEIISKATEEDRNHNYRDALRLYGEGIHYFMQAIKGMVLQIVIPIHVIDIDDVILDQQNEAHSEKTKESIRAKCQQYLDRAEQIRNCPTLILQGAIEIVTKATEEDRNKNYNEAVQLYEQAIADFMYVMKHQAQSEKAKESIHNKCMLYVDRADRIKKALKKYNLNAITSIIKAIGEDRNLNYEEALEWYIEGTDDLLYAIKYQSKGEKEKQKMESKRLHYLNRAEEIRKLMMNDTNANISYLQEKVDQLNLEENVCIGKISQTTWSDVIGLDAAKDALKESVALPMRYSNLFPNKKKFWKGILLFGPAGAGKSISCTALVNEVHTLKNHNRYVIRVQQLQSMNDSEKVVKALFEAAYANKPSIIFIDEVDFLCFSGSDEETESARRQKNEFLVQMKVVENSSDEILLVGATNKPWMLDEAILQHFEKRIYTSLPDEHARLLMFKLFLRKVSSELTEHDLKNLAKMTLGYSGKDINTVIDEVLMKSIRTLEKATHFKIHSGPCPKDPSKIINDLVTPCGPNDQGAIQMDFWDIDIDKLVKPPVTMFDMLKSLAETEPTVNEEDLAKFKKFADDYVQDS